MKPVTDLVAAVAVATLATACGDDTVENEPVTQIVVATIRGITIENPFAPEPVTPDAGALYFTLRNEGQRPDRLLTISVDVANDVSLHDQERSGGSMRMVSVQSIVVPAHGSVSLEPGGYHAMLRELHHHYRVGDTLTAVAEFEEAGTVTFLVPVISYADVADRVSHDDTNIIDAGRGT